MLEQLRSNLNSPYLYNWGYIVTYLLWRYENHLREKTGYGSPRLQWDTLVHPERPQVRYEKDHIEPQNPSNPLLVQRTKWLPTDEEERPFSEVCLHRLGNLVLDFLGTGAAKSDKGFVERIPYYERSTLLSQHELISVSGFASKGSNGALCWDLAAIRKRHKVLVEFAMTI
jgi:Protein of unknown function (DUF1524)